jgi:hypothetical protein
LRQRERALNVSASEQPDDCPVTLMARAAANAPTSPSACSVRPLSWTDPGR